MKNIVLFRHAKAHPLEDHQQDSQRELTSKGEQSLRCITSSMKQLIFDMEELEIVSSPYVRAVQTATILSQELGLVYEKTFKSIANGNFNAFVKDLKSCTAKNILVVGHQPYLSEFAYEIASVNVPFETASCACIELSSSGNRLIWAINNKTLQKIAK